ncbi:MAG: nucleotidyltransferase family protein [Methanophagales archaeon]|nr:nucleotidyltransferase family protein [Methanophagales archaeon]
MDVDRIERKMEEKKVYIKRVFHVREIGVFGSFIRGEQTASSDIDVLVEFERGHKDFFNYMKLRYYLEELLQRKIDLVIKNAVKPRLRKRIFSEVEYV